MAGVGLEHRGAQLDRGGGPAGQRDGDQRITGGGAGVPEAGEAVRLGPLRLADDLVDGGPEPWQSDAHGYAALAPEVLPAVADGRVRPIVDRVLPFDEARQAADQMRSNRAIGKIVIELP